MVWDGEEKRSSKPGRRSSDDDVCPFHKISCNAIMKNAKDIETLRDHMATKDDLREVKVDVASRAPWKVVALFISTFVVLGASAIGIVFHYMNETHKELVQQSISTKALTINQGHLMKAFGLKYITEDDIKKPNDKNPN